jgi:hypothetical protein
MVGRHQWSKRISRSNSNDGINGHDVLPVARCLKLRTWIKINLGSEGAPITWKKSTTSGREQVLNIYLKEQSTYSKEDVVFHANKYIDGSTIDVGNNRAWNVTLSRYWFPLSFTIVCRYAIGKKLMQQFCKEIAEGTNTNWRNQTNNQIA